MAIDNTTLPAQRDDADAPPANTGSINTELVDPPIDEASDERFILKDSTMATTKTTDGALTDRIRSSGERLASDAGEKARGLVSQGLERTAEALTNVSRMVGDTADGIDERLGQEYGDYARKAANALDKAAGTIASKNADELLEDTRTFVRNSPGIALAGAAVVGFVVARLLKSGLAADPADEA